GALMHGTKRWTKIEDVQRKMVFGSKPEGSDHDLVALARKAKAARKLPRILIDCGTDDFLIDDNREYTARLKSLRIEHTYEEFDGAHNWDYWDLHVQEALAFHATALKIRRSRGRA